MTLVLPFAGTGIRTCPKCTNRWDPARNTLGGMYYCPGKTDMMVAHAPAMALECMNLVEHLHVRCTACGYGWLEEVAPQPEHVPLHVRMDQ